MFGWIRRLRGQGENPENHARAHAEGRELARQMTETVDAYLAVRGRQIGETYLPILEQRLPLLLSGETQAPETVAQVEWLNYLRELSAVEETLLRELPAQMSELIASAEIVGIRPQLDQYLSQQAEATARRAGAEAALLVVRELSVARAGKGLPPLDLPYEGDAGELSGLQTAYVMANEAAKVLRQAVSEHLESRMSPMQERYLDAFQQRLGTIHDSPPHPAAVVAMAEWDIFRENVSEMREKLRDELDHDLAEWLNVADLGGFRSEIDQGIDGRIAQLAETLEKEGESLLQSAVAAVGGVPEQPASVRRSLSSRCRTTMQNREAGSESNGG